MICRANFHNFKMTSIRIRLIFLLIYIYVSEGKSQLFHEKDHEESDLSQEFNVVKHETEPMLPTNTSKDFYTKVSRVIRASDKKKTKANKDKNSKDDKTVVTYGKTKQTPDFIEHMKKDTKKPKSNSGKQKISIAEKYTKEIVNSKDYAVKKFNEKYPQITKTISSDILKKIRQKAKSYFSQDALKALHDKSENALQYFQNLYKILCKRSHCNKMELSEAEYFQQMDPCEVGFHYNNNYYDSTDDMEEIMMISSSANMFPNVILYVVIIPLIIYIATYKL